ncbi:MAG: hypothetical protein LBJ31_08110 [Treponema sp.]|jgi:hypothetical protein|nr:hypothetical protein [Treponema sp.]
MGKKTSDQNGNLGYDLYRTVQEYEYDDLYQLVKAKGTVTGFVEGSRSVATWRS